VIIFLLLRCGVRVDDDEVVARVGNTVLTREDMNQKMSWEGVGPDQESDFVDRWVDRELLYQEAKRLGLDKAVELQWEIELVEKEFVIQKLLERTFIQEVEITEEEIADYYESNKDEFQADEEEVRAFHILKETKAEADVARQEIIAGKPFETVARESSEGIFRERGGDMGFFRRGDVIPEIERYAFRLPEGQVSRVFRSNYGFHIIKVIKKRARGDYCDLPEVRDDIFHQLRVNKERSAYYDLLFQLQNRTKVSVTIPKSLEEKQDTLTVQTAENDLEESEK
jgi:peptidyl-prolyl cis-trans isomerase C